MKSDGPKKRKMDEGESESIVKYSQEDGKLNPKELLLIDERRLDEELVNFALDKFKITFLVSKVQGERDRLKLRRDSIFAELYREFKDASAKSGEKLTEASISNQIQDSDRYKSIYLKYIKANEEFTLINGLREDMHEKAQMLTMLASRLKRDGK